MNDLPDDVTVVCSTCSGPWIGNYRFDHADDCALGQADGRTITDDLAHLMNTGDASFTRDATNDELKIRATLGRRYIDVAEYHHPSTRVERVKSPATRVRRVDGEYHREVAGFDPDATITANHEETP